MSDLTLVSIVDDDESLRQSLRSLVRKFGFSVRAFASAEMFLGSGVLGETKCLILDVGMPGMAGPELQRELSRRGYKIPIIFITGRTDQDLRRQLLAEGAVECLFKPFSAAALREALNTALGVS